MRSNDFDSQFNSVFRKTAKAGVGLVIVAVVANLVIAVGTIAAIATGVYFLVKALSH